MIHTILIRDLNSLENLLPKDVPIKNVIRHMVLKAIEDKETHIELDDNNELEAIILEGIPLAKREENLRNIFKGVRKFHTKGI